MKKNYSRFRTTVSCFLLFCIQHFSYATIYYVANDGRDTNNGTSTATPFQTITKINSLTLVAGDQVLFRKGDTFRGQLNIRQSGTSGNPIIIDAYGTGNKPVISGSVIVTGWTNTSGNIWQATCSQAGSILTGVYSNSNQLALGRYPNYNAPNKGYNTIQSHSGNTQITSLESLANDWTGAEIVIRTVQWVIDRSTITSKNGNVLNFNATPYAPQDKWGYFIQNHPATLDQDGEWYYDQSTKKISIYSTQGNPENNTVEATVFSKGINLTGSFITI